ncbi:glucose-6-phosphate isomerase [Actinopolymorpha pittospori]
MTTESLSVAVERPHSDVLSRLIDDQVASSLAAKDPTLWGPEAEPEASVRLGWVDLPRASRPLLAEIDALRADLRQEGLDHIVLAGMGGSSLAPEVITATAGVELTVLDSTDPSVIRRAIEDRLEQTVLVVSSKSGSTVETDSHRRAYLRAFADEGIDGPRRIVVVTDPGSPLAKIAESEGYRKVFLADPNVGGRYSALSAFGLVPAGLAGVDVADLLDEAEAVTPTLRLDSSGNPALLLAACLGGGHNEGRDKVALGKGASTNTGFGAWAEQLIAESTGKLGKGLLPVDLGGTGGTTPGWARPGDDVTSVALGSPHHSQAGQIITDGPLGAMFQLWETAIALAGRVIGINPFDQPNVEEAKRAARSLLDQPPASSDAPPPAYVDGAVEVYGDEELLRGATTVRDALAAIAAAVPAQGYLAVLAYLDRQADGQAAALREALGGSAHFQVTFGWGPRFLHSTGQYHKGGHPNGAFVEITGAITEDLDVPDRPYTFGQLITAQAAGDLAVLGDKGLPTLRLHLTDRKAGLAQLLEAAGKVSS